MKTILVTGGSSAIAADLIEKLSANGDAVVATYRTNAVISTTLRNQIVSSAYEPEESLSSGDVRQIMFDVARPDFGLTSEIYSSLQRRIDLVLHVAALTEFGLAADDYRQTNIQGTGNILDFLATDAKVIPLVYVGTAFVCGNQRDEIMEVKADHQFEFMNEYENSKYLAERLVQNWIDAGNPAVIARPSIVVGRFIDGASRDYRNIYQVLRLTSSGRITSIPGNHDAAMDLVPIDHVVEGLYQLIVQFDCCVGRVYHLSAGSPTRLSLFADIISEFPNFLIPRFISPRAFRPLSLSRAERLYHQNHISLYYGYFSSSKWFKPENIRVVCGLNTVGVIDTASFLRRLLTFAEQDRYLPGTKGYDLSTHINAA